MNLIKTIGPDGEIVLTWSAIDTAPCKFKIVLFQRGGPSLGPVIHSETVPTTTGSHTFELDSITSFTSGMLNARLVEVKADGSEEEIDVLEVAVKTVAPPATTAQAPAGGTPPQANAQAATPPATTPASAGGTPAQAATPQTTTTSAPSNRWKFKLPKINWSAIPVGGVIKIAKFLAIGLLIMFCIGWFVRNREALYGKVQSLLAITPSPSRAGGSELVVSNGVMTSSRPRLNVGVPEVSVQGTNNSVQIFVTGDNSPVYYGVPKQQTQLAEPILETPPLSVSRDPVNPRPPDLAPGLKVGESILIRSGDKSFNLLPGQKAVIEKYSGHTPVLDPQNFPRPVNYTVVPLLNGDWLVTNGSDDVLNLSLSWR